MELSQIDPQVIVEDCPGLVVGRHLKTGGQKCVWSCAYKEKAYVLKALMADDETMRRVRREIEIMMKCDCPYLPKFGPLQLQELVLRGGERILYFLEEYITGTPLGSVVRPMKPREIIRMGVCVGTAIGAMTQKGYIHRDIKPMNIIQKSSSEYVLIDAGLALDPDGDAITMPGNIVGTRLYLSPDQVSLLPSELDERCDLFLLGIVMYEYATGHHPFLNARTPRGDVIQNILRVECVPPSEFNSKVPKRLEKVILKLLSKDRGERYSSSEELVAVLSKMG